MHSVRLNTEAFRVGCPQHHHLVKSMFGLEVTNVLTNDVEVLQLVLSGEEVVSSVVLVVGDEVRVDDGGQGYQLLQVGREFDLQVVLEHSSASSSLSQVHAVDVPTTNGDLTGVHHRQDVLHGDEDFFGARHTDLDGGALCDGTIEVGVFLASLRVEGQFVFVGQDTARDGGTIVTSPSNEHDSEFGDGCVGLEFKCGLGGFSDVLFTHLSDRGA